jgi:hypothetical protein
MTQTELEQILSKFNAGSETDDDWQSVVEYVCDDLKVKNGYDPTTEEITQQIQDMVTSYALRQLVKKGLIDPLVDENGDFKFELTEFGNQVKEELCGGSSVGNC